MLKRMSFALFTVLLLLIPLSLYAQGAPEQINIALTDLSAQVGRPVALGELQNWFWEQNIYPDASMGCPQPDALYAQEQTPAYKFTLVFLDKTYDYRVKSDGTVFILCSVVDANTPTATPDPAVPVIVDYVPPCPTPEPNINYQRIRLARNIQGRVEPGLPNNLRAEATSTSALVGEIPGEGIFTVIGGPACADGLVWWNVDYDGLVGWTVEGRDGDYWIEPLPPLALPATRAAISPDNVTTVNELARLQGNYVPKLGFTFDGRMLGVLGGFGSDGLWIYNMETITDTPRILAAEGPMTALAFNTSQLQAMTGSQQGWVSLFNLQTSAPVAQTLELKPFQSNIAALAFDPSRTLVASAGTLADITKANVDPANAIVQVNIDSALLQDAFAGHDATINALVYSPNGAFLASGGLDAKLNLWILDPSSQWIVQASVEQPSAIRSLSFSPDGSLLAIGLDDGSIKLWSLADGSEIATLTGHTALISGVSFNPDATLLASSSNDGTVIIWDLTSTPAEGRDILATIQTPAESIGSVAFSPDGTLIATVGNDNTVRLWGVSNSFG